MFGNIDVTWKEVWRLSAARWEGLQARRVGLEPVRIRDHRSSRDHRCQEGIEIVPMLANASSTLGPRRAGPQIKQERGGRRVEEATRRRLNWAMFDQAVLAGPPRIGHGPEFEWADVRLCCTPFRWP